MTSLAPPICFQCGLPATTGAADHFNRLSDGRTCPSCAERLLASLPPLLPGLCHRNETDSEPELAEQGEADFDVPA